MHIDERRTRPLTRRMRVLLTLLAGLVLAVPAPAHAQTVETAAVANNTTDDTTRVQTMFQIRRSLDDEVEARNAAAATASCTDCRTTAVSFQIALATGGPHTAVAENYAIALNHECTRCTTAAFAYQFFIANDAGPVRFTPEGAERLAEVQSAVTSLSASWIPPEELAVRLDGYADEVSDVLADEMRAIGQPDTVPVRADRDVVRS